MLRATICKLCYEFSIVNSGRLCINQLREKLQSIQLYTYTNKYSSPINQVRMPGPL